MYDQRQALGQPSLDKLKMIVVREFPLLLLFIFEKSPSVSSFSIVLFYFPFLICAICCVWTCFVRSCQYHFVDVNCSKTSQCLGQSLPLRPLYRLLFSFLFVFLFFQEGNKISWNWKVKSGVFLFLAFSLEAAVLSVFDMFLESQHRCFLFPLCFQGKAK